MGPYDGIVSASVDRVGRNVRDTLNTQALLTRQDRIVITADHAGVWDFSDPNEENNWIAKAWGHRWNCALSRSATGMRGSGCATRVSPSNAPRTAICTYGSLPRADA
jgi:hypothetical protein